jgi:hypothetical protein
MVIWGIGRVPARWVVGLGILGFGVVRLFFGKIRVVEL